MSEASLQTEFQPLTPAEIEDPAITQKKALSSVKDLEEKNWSRPVAMEDVIDTERKERAATLMHSFSEGAVDVVRSVARRNKLPANYRFPHVRIGDNSGVDARYAYSVNTQDGQPTKIVRSEIVVDAKRLDSLAQDDPSAIYEIHRENSDGTETIIQVGTPQEMAYTNGAEEAAHSIFLYQDVANGKFRPNKSTGSGGMDTAAYDAQPMEYHGRGWQVRAILDAKNEGKISAEKAERLTKPFIDRIQAAAKYKRDRKSSELSS